MSEPPEKNNFTNNEKNRLNLWDVSGIGTEFAIILGLFTYGGHFLDEKTGYSPLFLIAFLFGGFAFGLYYIVKRVSGK